MKRRIDRLAGEEHDILIIGAGIYGACAARDATLRGLKVAIIDMGDFGSATSQNSQKTIHGGLRYLQQADIVRMRESIRERRTLMKIAPQFVHPLPCVMPTYGHFIKGREALSVALFLNDLIGFDRNRLDDPQKHLPRGRTVSRKEIISMLPDIPRKGLTGGAIWYDAQTHNSERLLLSFILSAAEKGAIAANYVRATGFLTTGRRVCGVKALDLLSGEAVEIRAGIVLNMAGPWMQKVVSMLDLNSGVPPLRLSRAVNLVTRSFISGHAIGISAGQELLKGDAFVRTGSRLYFATPWRDFTLVGTSHIPYDGDPDDYRVAEEDIAELLSGINRAYPPARLRREDVRRPYGGLLPMSRVNRKTGEAIILKHYRIIDHAGRDGWEGIISSVGVKYTTARDVARKVVDLALKKLGRRYAESGSDHIPIYGGEINRFHDFLAEAVRSRPARVSRESMAHLVYHYGSRLGDILRYTESNPELANPLPGQRYVIAAEVVHAAGEEMAVKLADVVLRRTELGSAGYPGDDCIRACADLVGRELGWDDLKKQAEIESVRKFYLQDGAVR